MKLLFHFQDRWWQQVTEKNWQPLTMLHQHENPEDGNVQ
jgi:hypothetical protein